MNSRSVSVRRAVGGYIIDALTTAYCMEETIAPTFEDVVRFIYKKLHPEAPMCQEVKVTFRTPDEA
jgi:hypothetical protein